MTLIRPRPSVTRLAALVVLALGVVAAAPAEARFRGGGAVYDFNGCEAHGLQASYVQPVRVEHRPIEEFGAPGFVTIFPATGGAYSIQANEPLIARGRTRLRARGHSVWSTLYAWPNRPRLRIFEQRIVFPEGETEITDAEVIVIRFRVWNFNGLAGCLADVGATLRRE